MKCVVIIAIAVCVGLSEAVDLFAGITRLKNDVTSTSNDIERYGNNIIFQTKYKLNNLKMNEMQNVNNAVDNALAQIKNDIAAAKNEGKNADQCYEPARMQLRDASMTVFKQLDKCVEESIEPLNPVVNNIASHVTTGKMLLSELDRIALSCLSGTPMQTQICIAQKMPQASATHIA
ncbi:uncharacterized protein [Fopius arisanus]|uniref:Uncharacterized protein n=1 Tax=Fopius arisanus TaxID=64838 RepID=A0A9R1T201_9HYME|nr:PREDICTED: uncharacterized protein LOC105265553 [Fopius arisanus]